jgi:hypothetical protein
MEHRERKPSRPIRTVRTALRARAFGFLTASFTGYG